MMVWTGDTMQIHLSKPGGQKEGPYTLEQIKQDLAANKYRDIEPNKLDENLRLGANYSPWEPQTHFQFPQDHGRNSVIFISKTGNNLADSSILLAFFGMMV